MNPWCNLLNFTVHLKQKARVPPGGTIALLAEDGHLVKLEEETTQAPSMACSLIQEQVTYVLVQVISKWGLRPLCMLHYKGGTAGHRPTKILFSLSFGWALSPTTPTQCLSYPPAWARKQIQN